MPIERHFDQELAELRKQLLTMAAYAREAMNRSIQALTERDDELARQVETDDERLDQMEMQIDDRSIRLLALKSPVASDLRLITTTMKISQELERVADEATTISRRVIELNREPPLSTLVHIERAASLVDGMMSQALDAFVNRDSASARRVIGRDKEVDLHNQQLHRELASSMVENPNIISRALNLMVISKSIERIGDHAKNVAEAVVFLHEAADIRHSRANIPVSKQRLMQNETGIQ